MTEGTAGAGVGDATRDAACAPRGAACGRRFCCGVDRTTMAGSGGVAVGGASLDPEACGAGCANVGTVTSTACRHTAKPDADNNRARIRIETPQTGSTRASDAGARQ